MIPAAVEKLAREICARKRNGKSCERESGQETCETCGEEAQWHLMVAETSIAMLNAPTRLPDGSNDDIHASRPIGRAKKIDQFKVYWIDQKREPQIAPNPEFPNGKDVGLTKSPLACKCELPYPAKRCGVYIVECQRCGSNAMLTTAGRPDDPRSVTLPCHGIKA